MTLIRRLNRALSNEAVAGLIVISAALLALIIANSPLRGAYETMSHTYLGYGPLRMSIAHWAADGLLAIFFYVVGLELKQELTIGSLRDPKKAAVPVVAAIGGVAVPSLMYVAVQLGIDGGDMQGWAIPAATDIAFALAVLAICGRGLPAAARTFLMTLAVADDLIAIIIIAAFYSSSIDFLWLGASFAVIALYAFFVNQPITSRWLMWTLGILAWALMYMSGVHATIAGVALGLVVPTVTRPQSHGPMTHEFLEKMQPLSAGIAMPVFAFFAAGINVVDSEGIGELITDPVAVGVYLALPLGKFAGIMGAVVVMTKFVGMKLDSTLRYGDLVPVAFTAGIGFTVSLLIAQLTYADGVPHSAASRIAVLVGTALSAVVGAVLLVLRTRKLKDERRLEARRRLGAHAE